MTARARSLALAMVVTVVAVAAAAAAALAAPGHAPAPVPRAGSASQPGGATGAPGAHVFGVDDDLPLAFAHDRHATRGAAGRACEACHAGGDPSARVPLAACIACHDGTAAFATTSACTRCHTAPPKTAYVSPPPGARFSHAQHGAAATACSSCHALTPAGEPRVPSHAACIACHALHPISERERRAGAKDERICGACHDGTEPWRHLVGDRPPPETTELGASLDHGKHPATCTSCHTLAPARGLHLPHGHASCDAAGCHALAGGPAPALTRCDECHHLGVAAARLAARAAAPWSVRATFDHARHAARNELACAGCHTQLAGAQLLDLPTPAKPTCAPCHDGRGAFKLTGTACRRCHAGS